MTTLVVTDLITELEQVVRYNLSDRCSIAGFYPYLLMFNSPVGTFTFELIKGGDTVYSHTFDSQDIKDSLPTVNNYIHTFFPIVPITPIQIEKGLYTIKISASGYTANSTSYLAWVQQYENVQMPTEVGANNDSERAFTIRIKEYV